MLIRSARDYYNDHCTLGKMYLDGAYECETLEDTVRILGPNGEGKVKGKTAIPPGTYEVTITFSERFQRPLPLLLKVPYFEGIRIHPGNTEVDTEGCILVGRGRSLDKVTESRLAFSLLFLQLQRAISQGKIWLTIEDKK